MLLSPFIFLGRRRAASLLASCPRFRPRCLEESRSDYFGTVEHRNLAGVSGTRAMSDSSVGEGAGSLGDEGGSESGQGADASARRGKSCKGCLYYSSILKSGSNKPVCVGISRTVPGVPLHMIGEAEMKDKKEGHNLSDFKYACVGYSIFLDNNNPNEKQENRVQLPFCAGIELLVEKRMSTADHVHSSNRKEDAAANTPSRAHRPAHSPGDELLSRFRRNAGLVASGVVKNLNKVGNYIKENVEDMLYPYRRRPK